MYNEILARLEALSVEIRNNVTWLKSTPIRPGEFRLHQAELKLADARNLLESVLVNYD